MRKFQVVLTGKREKLLGSFTHEMVAKDAAAFAAEKHPGRTVEIRVLSKKPLFNGWVRVHSVKRERAYA